MCSYYNQSVFYLEATVYLFFFFSSRKFVNIFSQLHFKDGFPLATTSNSSQPIPWKLHPHLLIDLTMEEGGMGSSPYHCFCYSHNTFCFEVCSQNILFNRVHSYMPSSLSLCISMKHLHLFGDLSTFSTYLLQ